MMKRTLSILAAVIAVLLLAPVAQSFTSMRQVMPTRYVVTVPSSSVTDFREPFTNQSNGGGGEGSVHTVWAAAGSFVNLSIRLGTAPGAGKSWVWTLRKAGVDTALTCTIADAATTCSDVTHSVAVVAGDKWSLKSVPSGTPASPVSIYPSIEFVSTNTGESSNPISMMTVNTGTQRTGLFTGISSSWTTASGATVENVASTAGTLTATYINAGDGWDGTCSSTFTIYKNGVKQDGTGGTANTGINFTNADPANTTKNTTYSLTVTPGDTFWIERNDTGSSCFAVTMTVATRFVATTNGQSLMCGHAAGDMSNSATSYMYARSTQYHATNGWTPTTETPIMFGGITDFLMHRLYVKLVGSPGSGKSYTLSGRENTSSPGGAPSVVIADAATTGNDTTSAGITISTADSMTIRAVPSGTPTARAATWCWTQSDPALISAPGSGFNPLTVFPYLEARLLRRPSTRAGR